MAEETPTMTVEETLRSVIAAAKAGRFSKVANTPEGTDSWTIEAPTGTFVVENINRTSKTAREFNKTNFYKVQEDGTTKVFNLGEWKKKLFYTLLYCLQEGKVFHKIDQDPLPRLLRKIRLTGKPLRMLLRVRLATTKSRLSVNVSRSPLARLCSVSS